jgi:hypothetical protein
MKYLLLTEGTAYFPELLKPFERAGLYNWMKAFDGEVRLWGDIKKRKHELKEYDIVHINSYGDDVGLAAVVEPYLTKKTKLVVNMDLSIDYFDKNMRWDAFVKDIHAADFLFSVEPNQVNLINYIAHATKRKKPGWAHLVPHPVDIRQLTDKLWIPYNERMDVVAFQYHKYDAHWSIPKILMEKLPNDYLSAMLGYMGKPLDLEGLRHMVMPYMEWETYIKFLSRCKVGFEYRTHKAASRFVMEAGALGIPVVTTKDSHMGELIFPELCHEVGDFFGIRASLERLVTDEEYRLKQVSEGADRLEQFSLEFSKRRMMEMINDE